MTPISAGRAAEGERALGHTVTYVAACRRVAAASLTPERVTELYRAEDGLRLAALDSDSAALATAAAAADGALDAERAAESVLSGAWQGRTGWAATDFLNRQCESAAQVVFDLRQAADALRGLRAELASLVDAKIDAAVRIDDRCAGRRDLWLTEARTVLGGVADEASIGLVRHEIAPYVAADIAGDWVTAMMAATEAVRAAYDRALRSLTGRTPAGFGLPATPAAVPRMRGGRTSFVDREAPARVTSADAVTAPAPPPPLTLPAAPALGAPPADFGAMSAPGWPAAPDTLQDSDIRPPAPQRDSERDQEGPDEHDQTTPEGTEPDTPPADVRTAAPEGETVTDPAPTESVTAAPAPAAPEPAPLLAAEAPAETAVDERTPCEIAIDELPQVGD